jgi:hypothetical protein
MSQISTMSIYILASNYHVFLEKVKIGGSDLDSMEMK